MEYKINKKSDQHQQEKIQMIKLDRKVEQKQYQRLDVIVNKLLETKYNFNRILDDFDQQIKGIDLKRFKPPYLPKTFQIQRMIAYNKAKKLIANLDSDQQQKYYQKLIIHIDKYCFTKFECEIKQPYFFYLQKSKEMPIHLDSQSNLHQEFTELTINVSNFCVQVETFYDLIQRASLYEIYTNDQVIFENISTQLYPKSKFNIAQFSLSIFKRSIAFFSNTCSQKILSSYFLMLQKCLQNWTLFIAILSQIFVTHHFPWKILFSNGILPFLPYIIGYYVGSIMIGKIGSSLQQSDSLKQIQQFNQTFNQTTIIIQQQNDKISDLIQQYYNENDQNKQKTKLELEQLINSLLNNSIDLNKKEEQTKHNNIINQQIIQQLSELKIRVEEDWTIIVKQDYSEELIEDGFIKCDFL